MGLFNFFRKPDINQGVEEQRAASGSLLLDVRSPEEYRGGHIPGSRNLPISEIGGIVNMAEDKETPIFIYCYSGFRAGKATAELHRMGYLKAMNIGGIAGWQGAIEQ